MSKRSRIPPPRSVARSPESSSGCRCLPTGFGAAPWPEATEPPAVPIGTTLVCVDQFTWSGQWITAPLVFGDLTQAITIANDAPVAEVAEIAREYATLISLSAQVVGSNLANARCGQV
jgi:hypothetical protein